MVVIMPISPISGDLSSITLIAAVLLSVGVLLALSFILGSILSKNWKITRGNSDSHVLKFASVYTAVITVVLVLLGIMTYGFYTLLV